MTIGWIEIHLRKYGGVVYNEQARTALAKKFDVELVAREAKTFKKFRYFKIPESLLRLLFLKGEKDLWIRDFYSVLTMPFDKTQGKNIVMVHHVDFSGFPMITHPAFFAATKLFYRNLKKADAIVTVSEYWKQHFLQKGYSNVYKIYNGFDLPQFEISDLEVEEFKKKYGLEVKPIIYLGNCQKPKGVVETWNALKGLDAHLVTSGRPAVKIPARNLELSYREYLCLLKSSCVAVTMSKFKEGWNRTTHEAMLLGTPVIGSGLGGMRELLEGGNQMFCENFSALQEKTEYLLQNPPMRDNMGKAGYEYAKNFSLERFENEWLNFIKNTEYKA